MLKPLIVLVTTNFGKFFNRWKYQTTLPVSWEICMQVKKQQLELYMEQQTGSKSGKEYVKAVSWHPAYVTYMQSTHQEKCWAGGSTSWNQDCWEKYQYPQICRYHPYGESEEELKSLLMKVKNEREVTQSCATLCDPMDCSLPDSSIHRIFQARVLEWIAIAFSIRSSKKQEFQKTIYFCFIDYAKAFDCVFHNKLW